MTSCALPRRTQSLARCWRSPSPAIRGCRDWARISTSAPICRNIGYGATANWSRNRSKYRMSGATIWSIFALGCSFSFEQALVEDGIELRHIDLRHERADVPDHIALHPGRPVCRAARRLDAAAEAGRRDPCGSDHLALSLGARRAGAYRAARRRSASRIWASPITATRCRSGADELPVFWACGVTPQAVIAEARPEFCITHAPGSMLITDLRNSRLASL